MEAIKRYVKKYGHSNKKGLQEAYAEVYTSALPVNVARIIAYRHNEAQKHKDASSFDELVTVLQTRLTEPPLNDMSIVPIIRQSDFEFAKVTKPCPDMPSAKNVEDVEKTVCAFLFFLCRDGVDHGVHVVRTISVCFLLVVYSSFRTKRYHRITLPWRSWLADSITKPRTKGRIFHNWSRR